MYVDILHLFYVRKILCSGFRWYKKVDGHFTSRCATFAKTLLFWTRKRKMLLPGGCWPALR